jgi:hypothetical protein
MKFKYSPFTTFTTIVFVLERISVRTTFPVPLKFISSSPTFNGFSIVSLNNLYVSLSLIFKVINSLKSSSIISDTTDSMI